jgi:hypothetical protein
MTWNGNEKRDMAWHGMERKGFARHDMARKGKGSVTSPQLILFIYF